MTNFESVRLRAEASFKKKELRAREGAKALADYEADGRAVEKKTVRLKALRLAKEEGDRQAAPAKRSGPPRRPGPALGPALSTARSSGEKPNFQRNKL
jgi:hypothetical protein